MKFFIPHCPPEMAEEVYETIRPNFPKPPTARRIYRMEYSRNGGNYVTQVGEPSDEFGGEFVLAIFEYGDKKDGLYVPACVAGENHQGQPRLAPEPKHHFIPAETVTRIVDFEG